MRLEITKHAQHKMLIHGISIEQIKRTIKQGAKFEQTEGFIVKHSYITVAYKRKGDKYRIKTVFIN